MLFYFVTIVSPCFGANTCAAPNNMEGSRTLLRSFVFTAIFSLFLSIKNSRSSGSQMDNSGFSIRLLPEFFHTPDILSAGLLLCAYYRDF